MRFLMVYAGPYPHVGGLSTHIALMTRGLRKLGNEVDVLSFSSFPKTFYYGLFKGPAHVLNRIWKGLGTVYLLYSSRLLFSLSVLFMTHRERYDAVNAHSIAASLAAAFACKSRGIPLVQTVHTYFAFEMTSIGILKAGSRLEDICKVNEGKAYEESSYIIAVDNRIASHVLGHGIPPGKVVVMFNPVDVDEFHPGENRRVLRESFGLPMDKHIILCPRRLVKKNGVIYPTLAAAYLKQRSSDFLIVYAGDGEERRHIEDERTRLGLGDSVILLGSIDHSRMSELYGAVDLVVIPSVNSFGLEEATSISTLEAMAAGVPVIASAIGGLRDIIQDGVNGRLVKEGDERELADAISQLLSDRGTYDRMRESARKYVTENFSHMSRSDFFVSLLKRRDPPTEGIPQRPVER